MDKIVQAAERFIEKQSAKGNFESLGRRKNVIPVVVDNVPAQSAVPVNSP
jgi:hypothetical protein